MRNAHIVEHKLWFFAAVALALVACCGCNSSPATQNTGETKSMAAAGGGGGHIDVMCLGERINNPPESFHYSYTYSDAAGSVNDEADITPQNMEITIKDKSGSHVFHGVHSDEGSWSSAVVDLSHLNFTSMSAVLDSLNDGSAIRAQGSEAINGYQTTKYAIDTTSANSSDQQKFQTLFGQGSLLKGTAWMGQDGCAVKLSLDEAVLKSQGLEKSHFEISRKKM